MARPRKDANEPSAQEKMRGAFWSALKDGPYNSLTVKEICVRAGVQRNTFYYHYDGIHALADDAINALPIENFARKMLSLVFYEDGNPFDFVFSKENDHQVECMLSIAGPNGSPVLVESIKDRIWRAWSTLFPIPAERPIIAEFALGGMMAVFYKVATAAPSERRKVIENAPIKPLIRCLLPQVVGLDLSKMMEGPSLK